MKKITAIILTALLVLSLTSIFASAEGETNVALNKSWSGIEIHEKTDMYTGSFTDGVFETGTGFSYAAPWFTFYCNDTNPSEVWTNLENRVGKVDIALGDDGKNITKIRMQVAPGIGEAEYIKIFADDKEIGEMTYTGADIQWIELALDEPIDAEKISVEIKIKAMFFMVSEIEVLAKSTTQTPVDPDNDNPTTSDTRAIALTAVIAVIALAGAAVLKKSR